MKIVADDKIPFLKGALEQYAEVQYVPGKQITNGMLRDADALLIRTRTKCTPNLLEGTNVKFIGTATIGFDHIDIQYCERNHITWTNAPGCNSSSVQQFIAAALLELSYQENFTLKDKTLGIVGVGNVGSKVEKFATLAGMKVLLNDPPRSRIEGGDKFQNLDILLQESDIITIHVPLNIVGEDQTYHLFDEQHFHKMKKNAWFFNSSRGEVNDTVALKKMIHSGKLEGTVLDVWENEPDIDQDLMQMAKFASPHIAGYSTDGKANGTAIVVNRLKKHFNLPGADWFPGNIPEPESPVISINCMGKSEEEILREAVNHTYNIMEDDIKLRHSPSDFEKQRGNYRLRREFPAYTVNLKGGTENVRMMLENLGFNTTLT
jgi:erythronate-4-phosphate dehydrogenase